jgi:hypothetical protein
MSVAKYFYPYCLKPLYLIDSQDNAARCGLLNGIFYSFVFTIVAIVAGIKFYTSEKDDDNIRRIVKYGTYIMIISFWVFIPVLSYFGHKNIWTGYDIAKRELQGQGFDKMQIINILQLFEQNAASITSTGTSSKMLFASGQPGKGGKETNGKFGVGGTGGGNILVLPDK